MRFPFTHYIERGESEIMLHVVYDATAYVPARLYGDYPQPAEGGEVEIISVRVNLMPFTLTDTEEAEVLAACEERAPSDIENEAEAAAEWREQCRRDDFMMEDY